MGNCSGKKSANIQNPLKKTEQEISGSKFVRKDSFYFEDGPVTVTRTGDVDVDVRQAGLLQAAKDEADVGGGGGDDRSDDLGLEMLGSWQKNCFLNHFLVRVGETS